MSSVCHCLLRLASLSVPDDHHTLFSPFPVSAIFQPAPLVYRLFVPYLPECRFPLFLQQTTRLFLFPNGKNHPEARYVGKNIFPARLVFVKIHTLLPERDL
jgi:hypothetical protein